MPAGPAVTISAGPAITEVIIRAARTDTGNFDMFADQPGPGKLVTRNFPEIKIVRLHLKSVKITR
jgi:hypothetical protein